MSFNEQLIKLAWQEREYFKNGVKKEYEDPYYRHIALYWKMINLNYNGRSKDEHGNRLAWSAAFISWLIKKSRSGLNFPNAQSHSQYIRWATRNRRDNVAGAQFFAYEIHEITPQAGDILCNNREGGKITLKTQTDHYDSHGAIVVEVNLKEHYLRTIGGNEKNSVGLETVELDDNNHIIQPPNDRTHYICLIRNTVDAAISLPVIPVALPVNVAPAAPVVHPIISGSGIDTIVRLNKTKVDCLRDNGQKFVLKYLYPGSLNVNKNWTPQELLLCRDAGLLCGSIMQRGNNGPGSFSKLTGTQQGNDAHDKAKQLGQPTGTAIYFGVDFDASISEFKTRIRPYFDGVAAALHQKNSPYLTGAYGSALVLEELQKLDLINFAWLPGSTGWGFGRYQAYLASNKWDLRQTPDTSLCGFSVDLNKCRDLSAAGLFKPN